MTIPIGNADAGSYFNDKVLAAVDYGMANVHPWFANVSVEESAGWTWEFFQENDVELAQSLANTPQMYIAETGWPTVRFFPTALPSFLESCWREWNGMEWDVC